MAVAKVYVGGSWVEAKWKDHDGTGWVERGKAWDGSEWVDIGGAVPVTIDAVGPGGAVNGAAATWTHTATGNAVVVFAMGWRIGGTVTALSAAYDGSPMTLLDEIVVSSDQRVGVFGLLNPPVGAKTVSVSTAGSGGTIQNRGNSLSYNDVAAFVGTAKSSGTGTTASLIVPSAAGELIAQGFFGPNGSTGYTQTLRAAAPAGWHVGDADGAASVSFGLTLAFSSAWQAIAVRMKP